MKDPSFPFYAQDFLTGVMHMTMAERGVFITLLSYQWSHGQIPKKRLGFILGSGWEECWETLASKFIEDGDYLFNERLEAERQKRAVFKAKQSENGKKGGRKPKPNPDETQTETQNISQIKPLENEYENEYEYKEDKGGKGEKEEKPKPVATKSSIPTLEEFQNYAREKEPAIDLNEVRLKYEAWKVNNWRDGNNGQIKNWKSKLLNTIPFMKKNFSHERKENTFAGQPFNRGSSGG